MDEDLPGVAVWRCDVVYLKLEICCWPVWWVRRVWHGLVVNLNFYFFKHKDFFWDNTCFILWSVRFSENHSLFSIRHDVYYCIFCIITADKFFCKGGKVTVLQSLFNKNKVSVRPNLAKAEKSMRVPDVAFFLPYGFICETFP